jgi:tyrosinase
MPMTLELSRPPHDPDEFSRADLQFRGVDHSGPSYEALVFLDNPRADASTPLADDEGFAGSFHVFGHGGCFGELGHCDVREAPRAIYDRRLAHPLTPQFKTLIVTDALRHLMRTSRKKTFAVTVVAVVPENPVSRAPGGDPLKFESLSLIVDQDPAAAGIPPPPDVGGR